MTWNLEDSQAVRWMTASEGPQDLIDLAIYDQGQFGYVEGDSMPRWVAIEMGSDHEGLPSVADTLFYEVANGKRYMLKTTEGQQLLWRELQAQQRSWLSEERTTDVIFGPMKGGALFFAYQRPTQKAHMALVLPPTFSKLPLSHFMVPITTLEQDLGFRLFRDVVDDEEELSLLDKERWPLDTAHYFQRLKAYDTYGAN